MMRAPLGARRAASEPEALVAFFGACGMTMQRVGLEACSLTAWLPAGLTEAGIPAICIEARQAKAAMGAMPNKTDRNDARDRADHAHRVVSRSACQKPILPILAGAADGAADGAEQAARRREWHPCAAA
jgi:transposase